VKNLKRLFKRGPVWKVLKQAAKENNENHLWSHLLQCETKFPFTNKSKQILLKQGENSLKFYTELWDISSLSN
jgi:hypothetical protein